MRLGKGMESSRPRMGMGFGGVGPLTMGLKPLDKAMLPEAIALVVAGAALSFMMSVMVEFYVSTLGLVLMLLVSAVTHPALLVFEQTGKPPLALATFGFVAVTVAYMGVYLVAFVALGVRVLQPDGDLASIVFLSVCTNLGVYLLTRVRAAFLVLLLYGGMFWMLYEGFDSKRLSLVLPGAILLVALGVLFVLRTMAIETAERGASKSTAHLELRPASQFGLVALVACVLALAVTVGVCWKTFLGGVVAPGGTTQEQSATLPTSQGGSLSEARKRAIEEKMNAIAEDIRHAEHATRGSFRHVADGASPAVGGAPTASGLVSPTAEVVLPAAGIASPAAVAALPTPGQSPLAGKALIVDAGKAGAAVAGGAGVGAIVASTLLVLACAGLASLARRLGWNMHVRGLLKGDPRECMIRAYAELVDQFELLGPQMMGFEVDRALTPGEFARKNGRAIDAFFGMGGAGLASDAVNQGTAQGAADGSTRSADQGMAQGMAHSAAQSAASSWDGVCEAYVRSCHGMLAPSPGELDACQAYLHDLPARVRDTRRAIRRQRWKELLARLRRR